MPDAGDVARMKRIVARVRADDVRVIFVAGWDDRGGTFSRVPVGIFDHHDASSVASGTWGALGTIVAGRPGIPGPLSQFQVARGSVPQIAVVAAGTANHGGLGGPHKGIPQNSANAYTYGAEKANNGAGESYSDASIYATRVLFAAVLEECDASAAMAIGHKEWAPDRKIDPRYSMPWMRNLVAETMAGEDDMSEAQFNALKDSMQDLASRLSNAEQRLHDRIKATEERTDEKLGTIEAKVNVVTSLVSEPPPV